MPPGAQRAPGIEGTRPEVGLAICQTIQQFVEALHDAGYVPVWQAEDAGGTRKGSAGVVVEARKLLAQGRLAAALCSVNRIRSEAVMARDVAQDLLHLQDPAREVLRPDLIRRLQKVGSVLELAHGVIHAGPIAAKVFKPCLRCAVMPEEHKVLGLLRNRSFLHFAQCFPGSFPCLQHRITRAEGKVEQLREPPSCVIADRLSQANNVRASALDEHLSKLL
mmetsp:Transcript_18670/g.44254  ORF Transcript_18670/g.44254 Transcript_18670/m.44254 type:complete len:221 (+) Transcript_18670:691-1353(+)